MIRVVLDTNVLVSGLLFGGTPGDVLRLCRKTVVAVASAGMIDECLRVLAYPKFRLADGDIRYLLERHILPIVEVVDVVPGESVVAADPKDDMFVWCARQAKASAIVSGDAHLLSLSLPDLEIVTAAEAVRLLKKPHLLRCREKLKSSRISNTRRP